MYSRHPSFFRIFLTGLTAVALLCPLPADAAKRKGGGSAPNNKYASIVVDATTGAIISESNPDKRLHPASLVKMMTIMMAFDGLANGTLRLSDSARISQHAASMSPSKLGLKPGSSIRIEDAIYALVTKSANDIAAALGEKIGGTESQFATMMTRRAREIGMNNTTFKNASGLHHPAQVSTARDMALLARYILTRYPQYYHYFSTRQFSYRGVKYRNHNRLMETYRGMDGFKTGYTVPAGFNLVASARRGDRRLIGVVFGGRSTATRNAHMAELLDRGFGGAAPTGNALVASVAPSAPLPGRKPVANSAGQVSSNQIIALASPATIAAQKAPAPVTAPSAPTTVLSPSLQSPAFEEMIGQGDSDPASAQRVETGLMAIADIRRDHAPVAGTVSRQPQGLVEKSASTQNFAKGWSVQIGAFSSRAQTDAALKRAASSLPGDLRQGAAVIVPLKTKEGWLFRGRINGYDKAQAERACVYLKDCLPVSPQAY